MYIFTSCFWLKRIRWTRIALDLSVKRVNDYGTGLFGMAGIQLVFLFCWHRLAPKPLIVNDTPSSYSLSLLLNLTVHAANQILWWLLEQGIQHQQHQCQKACQTLPRPASTFHQLTNSKRPIPTNIQAIRKQYCLELGGNSCRWKLERCGADCVCSWQIGRSRSCSSWTISWAKEDKVSSEPYCRC